MPRDVLIRQLQDGLVLLVLGMGFVFIFLAVLVFATKAMSKVCAKASPAVQPAAKKAGQAVSNTNAPASAGASDAEVAIAIAAAYSKSKN